MHSCTETSVRGYQLLALPRDPWVPCTFMVQINHKNPDIPRDRLPVCAAGKDGLTYTHSISLILAESGVVHHNIRVLRLLLRSILISNPTEAHLQNKCRPVNNLSFLTCVANNNFPRRLIFSLFWPLWLAALWLCV